MKLIDDKGRLFGRVNVIDLFVILVVVAAVAFLGFKFLTPKVASNIGQEDYILTFFCEQTPDFVAENLAIGGKVEDEAKNIDLGKIQSLDFGEGFLYIGDDKGELHRGYMEGYSSVELTTECKGQAIEGGGIKISGNTYVIGHSFTVRAGKGKLYLRFAGFEKKQ